MTKKPIVVRELVKLGSAIAKKDGKGRTQMTVAIAEVAEDMEILTLHYGSASGFGRPTINQPEARAAH